MEVAICVKNVNFFYGNPLFGLTSILKDINVNVPKGQIYGLLGPSGCGKTSLLKIIIGILRPKSGSVSVFGFQPGTSESGIPGSGLGYMPQEYACPPALTIEETFYYFGKLYLMSKRQIDSEVQKFVHLFQLPGKNRKVDNLSGGQKQRVSLAISLFHKPRLVILDEPTVGIDPLLREKVWQYLNQLSENEQTTIIITTHYIEELKRAGRIGFMRKGQMICEDSPLALVKKFGVNNLEEIFYLIAKKIKSEQSKMIQTCEDNQVFKDNQTEVREEFIRQKQMTKLDSFYTICACLLWKSIKTTLRQPGALILNLIFAPFLLWCANSAIGTNPTGLKFAYIVDEINIDYNVISMFNNSKPNDFRNMSKMSNWTNENVDEDNVNLYLPDMFRQLINTKLITLDDNYKDLKTAIEDIKHNKLTGALYIGPNFSDAYIESNLFIDDNEWIHNQTILDSRVYLYIDDANIIFKDMSIKSIETSLNKLRVEVWEKFKDTKVISDSWIDVGQPIYGQFEPENYGSFRYSFILGYNVQLLLATSFEISAFGVFSELESNLFVRSRLAGVSSFQVVISNILANALFLTPNTIIFFLLDVFFVEIPLFGSAVLALTLLSLQTLIGICLGILTVTAFRDIFLISGLVTALALAAVFTSGALWPFIAIPYYFKWCAELLPFPHIIDALVTIFLRADAPFMPFVVPGFLISIITILTLIFMSVVVLNSVD